MIKHEQISKSTSKLLLILTTLLSIGCSTLRNLNEESVRVEKLDQTNYELLNGTYCDLQDTVFGQSSQYPRSVNNSNERSLARRLLMKNIDWHDHEGKSVEINFITPKMATVNLYQNDSLLISKKIKGQFKNGYFYIQPKVLFIPLFPVFYVHRFENTRIGKMGNFLVVDHTWNSSGFALIGGGMSKGNNTAIYEKLP